MNWFRGMLVIAVALGCASALHLFGSHLVWTGVLACVVTGSGAGAVAFGMRRHRPGPVGVMLLASTAINCVAMIAWYAPVLAGGDTTLAQPSVADALWLVADPLLAVALLFAVTRRERGRHVALDVLTIAAALALVAGIGLIGPDFATTEAPFGVRMTQSCYVISDVFIASAVLRVLLAPRGRPLALWLLTIAGASLVVSDFAWNWLTIAGTYMPGSWADFGWMAAPLLIGLAALHPSVRALGADQERDDLELRTSGTILLGLALLVAPLLLGTHRLLPFIPDVDETLASTLAVVGGGTVLAGLVVLRFMLLLGRARRLADAAGAALRERDELLSQSQSRYRALVEQLPGITLVFAIDEGSGRARPEYVSPQSEVILGLSADEWRDDFAAILGRIHADDRVKVAETFAQVVADGAALPVEFRFLRADGDEIWLGDAGAMLTEDSSGRWAQTMLFDISDAKRAQAEHEAMELELRLGQKLEAVGELAAGIAHEINTPTQYVGDTVRFLRDAFDDLLALQDVQTELAAALDGDGVSAELRNRLREAEELADLEYLRDRVPGAFDRADDGIQRVGAIVSAMREFAHPPTADKAPVQLNEALHNTLVVATSEYRYVADVETDFADLPPVVCNGGDINQVFLNLIVNAAHAIEDRGEDRGAITITTRVRGECVVVSIADTGCGIPADVAARIFDPFFTTKEVGRGTGQGLAIARTIVDRHGGALTFDTEPNAGTTFHIRLPIGHDALPAAVAA